MSEATASLPTQRVALVLQYLGTHFHGWQRQPHHRSVQAEIEAAIASVVGKRIVLHGAGRTDSGVHAAAQVAHFDVVSSIPAAKWAKVLNSRLPADINILASAAVAPKWHAQYSAQYRRYRYTLYTGERPNLFVSPYVWHYYRPPLDETLMEAALKPLVGKHHLSAFRRANSLRPHSWVEVQEVKCDRHGHFLEIEIQASGFLYGMVRLIVGMLVQVGSGTLSLVKFTDLWKQERRDEIKYAAPPQGLCLLRVGYADFPFPHEVWFDTQPRFSLVYE